MNSNLVPIIKQQWGDETQSGSERCDADEKWQAKKKTAEKALIPLPPTGFVSFVYANPDVVQTNLQARRAVGLRRRSVISFCVRF
ncbi:hypothetical protein [Pseudomonas sp. ES3]|uniref:hypothetical protein n=1 Tax=Pseudomonas sp. ES3 TaxID=3424776 RepID=UPI003D32F5EA